MKKGLLQALAVTFSIRLSAFLPLEFVWKIFGVLGCGIERAELSTEPQNG